MVPKVSVCHGRLNVTSGVTTYSLVQSVPVGTRIFAGLRLLAQFDASAATVVRYMRVAWHGNTVVLGTAEVFLPGFKLGLTTGCTFTVTVTITSWSR